VATACAAASGAVPPLHGVQDLQYARPLHVVLAGAHGGCEHYEVGCQTSKRHGEEGSERLAPLLALLAGGHEDAEGDDARLDAPGCCVAEQLLRLLPMLGRTDNIQKDALSHNIAVYSPFVHASLQQHRLPPSQLLLAGADGHVEAKDVDLDVAVIHALQ